MISRIALVLLLTATAATAASTPAPKAGNYAFNWLDPDGKCWQLTAKDVAKIRHCEDGKHAFGEADSLMCKVDANREWVVYATAAQCQEGLEIMQANGD